MTGVRILPAVVGDVAEAADYYDWKGYPGLGYRFEEVFYAAIPHLREKGEVYSVAYSEFRKLILEPFPYLLYYRYFEERPVIALVVHAARRSG
jgi:hypothetical protein